MKASRSRLGDVVADRAAHRVLEVEDARGSASAHHQVARHVVAVHGDRRLRQGAVARAASQARRQPRFARRSASRCRARAARTSRGTAPARGAAAPRRRAAGALASTRACQCTSAAIASRIRRRRLRSPLGCAALQRVEVRLRAQVGRAAGSRRPRPARAPAARSGRRRRSSAAIATNGRQSSCAGGASITMQLRPCAPRRCAGSGESSHRRRASAALSGSSAVRGAMRREPALEGPLARGVGPGDGSERGWRERGTDRPGSHAAGAEAAHG